MQTAYPLAMVFCDMIHRDPLTGKRTLLGCFSELRATHFPYVHAMMATYVAFTDVRGQVVAKVRIVDVDEEHGPLFEQQASVNVVDQGTVAEADALMPGVRFPTPGVYTVQFFVDARFLRERRLPVVQVSQ